MFGDFPDGHVFQLPDEVDCGSGYFAFDRWTGFAVYFPGDDNIEHCNVVATGNPQVMSNIGRNLAGDDRVDMHDVVAKIYQVNVIGERNPVYIFIDCRFLGSFARNQEQSQCNRHQREISGSYHGYTVSVIFFRSPQSAGKRHSPLSCSCFTASRNSHMEIIGKALNKKSRIIRNPAKIPANAK